jgi:hypothetical protein
MASTSIKELALLRIKIEEEERLAKEQATLAAAAARAAERDRLEREARVLAAAERQQALLRAERLEAEQAAAKQAAAEQAALDAEITRLRARTPLEIMQDEMAEIKRQMATFSRPPPPEALHLRLDGELDMRFKSSKEELATARAEIAELKALVRGLCILTTNVNIPATIFHRPWLMSLTQPCRDLFKAVEDTDRKM